MLATMKINKTYRKHNGQFAKRYEGLPMFIGYLFLITLACMVASYVYFKATRMPLVSPLTYGPVQVMAKEKEIVPCEKDVKNFLECEVINGNITEKQAKIMLAIAKAESGLKETAQNRHSTARGTFQILAGTWYSNNCIGNPLFWKDNTICAIKIMKNQGFYAWEVFNTGSYKKHFN